MYYVTLLLSVPGVNSLLFFFLYLFISINSYRQHSLLYCLCKCYPLFYAPFLCVLTYVSSHLHSVHALPMSWCNEFVPPAKYHYTCPKYHYTSLKCREVPVKYHCTYYKCHYLFHLSRHRDIQYVVFLHFFLFLLLTYQFCVGFRFSFPRSFFGLCGL